jgi:hypothetical protein
MVLQNKKVNFVWKVGKTFYKSFGINPFCLIFALPLKNGRLIP